MFQRDICLRHDTYATSIPIDDRNTPDLMFLHRLLATLDIIVGSACNGVRTHEFANRIQRRIKSICHN